MYDNVQIEAQRSDGVAAVSLRSGGGLARLYQQGCAKAFLPRAHTGDPEVVLLNTAGGLTGGDHIRFSLEIDAGARATATTQAAERVYRAITGSAPGKIEVDARVGDGAFFQWLPQETILFDGASLERRTRVDLSGSARFLMCETLVFGRRAMGEEVKTLWLLDRREIIRDGVPVFTEPLEIAGADLSEASAGAGIEGARCLATVVMVGAGVEDLLGPVRATLEATPYAGASAWEGKLVVRAMGPDPTELRKAVASVLITLRNGALPRVWQM